MTVNNVEDDDDDDDDEENDENALVSINVVYGDDGNTDSSSIPTHPQLSIIKRKLRRPNGQLKRMKY